ncbi:hypothetical protein VE25_10930 [Devosia geojensis]|uniref:Uncharacterized protein n=1 Tax=Devosia geojensis TaxID=443610 RepID=A0A0F5FU35_9HYPH|nr:hypothetical protein [Devosia geojensis]KKB11687.1 hypothetical protein VE25_10930 [Devosia geojensis]
MDLLLACHISQLNALKRPPRGENMEDAYFRTVTTSLPALGGVTRLAVAAVLLVPLISVLAYSVI